MPEIQAFYSNDFAVGHNEFEFVLEFGQSYGEAQSATQTRIVTSPYFAKQLLVLLGRAIAQFEKDWGPIASSETNADA